MQSVRRLVFGAPKDVKDPEAFHNMSLIALLAWVGLGADGLSSSAYGPDEAFRALGEHTGLAFFLALATAFTVFIISYGYTRIIEHFPTGGGGYVVASRLLGSRVGVVSGAALLIDYVLTITISVASGADAVFSFLPPSWAAGKLVVVSGGLVLLTVMNIRGVKESVTSLVPVFVLFLILHALLLVLAIGGRFTHIVQTATEVHASVSRSVSALGIVGTISLFVRAYSMGGGTYTGIEAVSNGVAMMREPRVQTAKRTMLLMGVSLAVTAGGILLAYLLVGARAEPGKTMNAVLLERVLGNFTMGGLPVGQGVLVITLLSEGALLFVAAQAGFLDGPRVMANMATDSWLPHRFAALSDRLSMRNGVLLMSAAAFGALIYTRGDVSKLVVMYSINVFVTFSLSNLAMSWFWIRDRAQHPDWYKHLPAHVAALILCVTILAITIYEKIGEGGWLTLVMTAVLITLCFYIRVHYRDVWRALRHLDTELPSPLQIEERIAEHVALPPTPFEVGTIRGLEEHHGRIDPDPSKPVALLFVGGYSGLGRHALLTLLDMFPGHFAGVVFLSVAVVDSESFKGPDQLSALEQRTRESLLRYEYYAQSLGLRASSALSVGTEVAVECEKISLALVERYPKALFVAGQLIFQKDTFWNRVLHNETAFMVQKRLQHNGIPMIVVPVRIDLDVGRAVRTPLITAT